MQWVMAAALICSASMFTACSNDDNPVTLDKNLSEKIIGKWMMADMNGQPLPTNLKGVFTFTSATQAFISVSSLTHYEAGDLWNLQNEYALEISGDKLTLTKRKDEHQTSVYELTVSSINANEMLTDMKITIIADGQKSSSPEMPIRLVKVDVDYTQAIVGLWEGRCTSEGSVFDDGQEHRWEYKADGTFVYYVKDGDNWVPSANTLNEYFVDGSLLFTRWVDNGQDNREWWEITIAADKMNWTALRQNNDGTTFTATFEMKKIQ